MGLKKSEYEKYISSPQWRAKRKEAFKFHGRICSKCGATKKLQVHHLTYVRLCNELMEDLQILCVSCHGLTHGKVEVRRQRQTREFISRSIKAQRKAQKKEFYKLLYAKHP